MSDTEMAGTRLCTFVVDGLRFGVDVMNVQEVLREQEMTRVPLAPDSVRGLVNLRGEIVTAIDLRVRLGCERRAAGDTAMNVVATTKTGIVTFLVDEIGDVVEVDADNLERAPEMMAPRLRDLVRGLSKSKDGILLVLDVERACADL